VAPSKTKRQGVPRLFGVFVCCTCVWGCGCVDVCGCVKAASTFACLTQALARLATETMFLQGLAN